ncbi:GspH/FimT family pseudopilin [Porticoccus sp. GXU_MW_L64]
MKNLPQNPPRQTGFTLIELMITVLILAILVGVGVPAMNNFLNSNRLTAHTSALKQAIQYARSEAVSKNQDVSICASSNGVACTGNWNQGWIVRQDSDGSVLRVWNGLSDNSTISTISGGATITFSSTGDTDASVTFQINDPTGSSAARHARRLQVNNVGWVTVTRGGAS